MFFNFFEGNIEFIIYNVINVGYERRMEELYNMMKNDMMITVNVSYQFDVSPKV